MVFEFKTMNVRADLSARNRSGGGGRCQRGAGIAFKTDEFGTNNDELCINNDAFCI